MGEVEVKKQSRQIIIHSKFFFYGDVASEKLSIQIGEDIARHWNEPKGVVKIYKDWYAVSFDISGVYEPDLKPETVWYNDNPRFNFFRIEEFVVGNISFVDGLGSNTGYFKLDNLLQTSTTAAHEYGHTLGLEHPDNLDIRGNEISGMMYPRGTICDAHFQYDPTAAPSEYGGFLNPAHRKVLQADIDAMKLPNLSYNERGFAIIGNYSSLYHPKHVAS